MSDDKHPPSGDQATVTVFVAVAPPDAFEVFTQETDLWWRRGFKYRLAGRQPGTIYFEPHVGGRLLESFETESGTRVYETGRITVWEPPRRLMVTWRGSNFRSGESTELEVLFEPSGEGTRVTVQHRGWAALRPDHPARHGLEGAAFNRMIGMWWGDQLVSMREYIETKSY
jgi:uncharacterized protein YndB with AHSA1/START domain